MVSYSHRMTTLPELPPPVAVWDANEPGWAHPRQRWEQRYAWARRYIELLPETFRIEFYLLDGPFAVVHRYQVNADGFRWRLNGAPAEKDLEIVTLPELPPADFL
jgi:hypothetical protein